MTLDQLKSPSSGEEVVIINTNHGNIKLRLFPEIAPKAVENFKTHIENGYYDGITFHRVIDGFMIQGGDPEGTGLGGESIWGEPFENEIHHGYHHVRGTLSMANAGPNTNGSQFFIIQNKDVDQKLLEHIKRDGIAEGFSYEAIKTYEELGGTPWLDFQHTIFGQVYEGMDVVDKIARLEKDEMDKPIEPAVMEKVKIAKY